MNCHAHNAPADDANSSENDEPKRPANHTEDDDDDGSFARVMAGIRRDCCNSKMRNDKAYSVNVIRRANFSLIASNKVGSIWLNFRFGLIESH